MFPRVNVRQALTSVHLTELNDTYITHLVALY